jgi:hypothetical protein
LLSLDNGKDDEAAALVDQVRKTTPVDQRLIATLTQAMDMLGKGIISGFYVQCIDMQSRKQQHCMRKHPKSVPKMRSSENIGLSK